MDEKEIHYAKLSEKAVRKKIEALKLRLEKHSVSFDAENFNFEDFCRDDEEISDDDDAKYDREVPLINLSVKCVCDQMDVFMKPYLEKEEEILDNERPKFGKLAVADEASSQKILEYLIETESLKPLHLKVLLENNATHLPCPCRENSYYTPFTVETLKIISLRCPNFQELHFHSDVRDKTRPGFKSNPLVDSVVDSLKRLSTSVTVLNFTDAGIDDQIMKTICTSFKSLKELNLHQALMEWEDFDSLYDPKSAIMNTIESLHVDGTSIPTAIVGRCLEHYKNLKYIKSDATISALLFLQKLKVKFPDSFETTILKQRFNKLCWDIPDSKLKEKVTDIVQMFPKVNHLIFTTIQRKATKLVNEFITTSLLNITKLELSCFGISEEYEFLELMPVFENEKLCDTLTSLTLECYFLVDVFYLIERCEKLEELVLINNTYKMCNKNYWMPLPKLRVLKIMFLSQVPHIPGSLNKYQMDIDTFCAVFSSRSLRKVVIVDQKNFEIAMERSLDSGFLAKLRELYFFSCQVRLEVLMKIFEKGESLKKVEYSDKSVHRGATDRILELVNDKYYEASLLPRDNLPYWLRWDMVCLKLFKKKGEIIS